MENKSLKNEARIALRASKSELDKWKSQATQNGYNNFVGFLRDVLNKHDTPLNPIQLECEILLLKELKLVRNEIVRVGNNVNQIARILNKGDNIHKDILDKNLNDCDVTIDKINTLISNYVSVRK